MTRLLVALVLAVAVLAAGALAHAQPEPFVTYGMPGDAVGGPVIEAFCNMADFVQKWTSEVAP